MNDTKLLFPSSIDINNDELQFIHVNQQELDNLAFHDTRLSQYKSIVEKQNISNINDQDHQISLSYIFHTAFCGSTFLSKLLGNTQYYFSVREPNIFMELANLKRINEQFKNNSVLFQSLVNKTIISFSCPNKKKMLFKPTNATNNIIDELLIVSNKSKALFLYIDLNDFLVSILKKGEAGRSFIRNLYNILSLDSSPYIIQDFRQVNALTDLQIASLVWAMQIYEYQKFYHLNDKITFLHADKFLTEPENVLLKASSFLGVELDNCDLKDLKEKGMFTSHSKYKGREYTGKIREKEKEFIVNKYADDLKSTQLWMNKAIQLPQKPPKDMHLLI